MKRAKSSRSLKLRQAFNWDNGCRDIKALSQAFFFLFTCKNHCNCSIEKELIDQSYSQSVIKQFLNNYSVQNTMRRDNAYKGTC